MWTKKTVSKTVCGRKRQSRCLPVGVRCCSFGDSSLLACSLSWICAAGRDSDRLSVKAQPKRRARTAMLQRQSHRSRGGERASFRLCPLQCPPPADPPSPRSLSLPPPVESMPTHTHTHAPLLSTPPPYSASVHGLHCGPLLQQTRSICEDGEGRGSLKISAEGPNCRRAG